MSTLKVNTIQDTSGGGTTLVSAQNTAKAWVNFKPNQATLAIRDSYNVASITDHGVGEYTVNFATAMSNANYSAIATGDDVAYGGCATYLGEANITTTSCKFQYRGNYPSDPARYDGSTFSAVFFGD